ncbi:MAG: hypothetical protein CMM52_16450 [Rhodospirillaceae bacterium]|nr:hypothetical protein [Rhodospirillaceae bacterium]|tara:strand:- start:11142 stop:12632 length:1491 start_codon:yes stop_codon:yes gene_type:complete
MLLIDMDRCTDAAQETWKKENFIDRVSSLEMTTAIFDSKERNWPVEYPAYSNLLDAARNQGLTDEEMVIVVDGDQIAFDADLVRKIASPPTGCDYYTQWEHCRIPLGVGARGFRAATIKKSGATSPSAHLSYIQERPLIFTQHYETETRTDFMGAKQDTRANGSSPENWGETATDDRGLPSSYGFETKACAEFPTYIMFDLTNRCNATCIHCPHSTWFAGLDAKPHYLDYDMFKRVVDECAGHEIHFVRFTADGEPLIHPRLVEMIDYCGEKGVGPTGLTTNGSLLKPEKAQLIAESRLFMIDFSLDGFSEETFSKIRVGLSYEKVMENINYLLDYKAKIGSNLQVMVSFVIQNENLHEVEAFKEYWEPKVDKVLIRGINTNVNLVDTKPIEDMGADERWPCPHWWRRMVITSDGLLKPCPIDWNNGTAYKHFDEVSIQDAWHSDFFKDHRMQHLNNEFTDCSVCKGCKDWTNIPWEMGYEKVIAKMSEQEREKTD